MTSKSHCVVNAVLAYVLTGRPEVSLAAMLTSTLPDQLEILLPLGRHRGATHWLSLWLIVMVAVPMYFRTELLRHLATLPGHPFQAWPTGKFLLGTCLFGLALGPFLHVLMDGCSDSGVPVAPFSRQKLRLGMYRTSNHRWRWDVSEPLFLGLLIVVCILGWRLRH